MHVELLLNIALSLGTIAAGPDDTVKKPNALSKTEADEGWLLLFDGQSLFGWNARGNGCWRVLDGSLTCEKPSSGGIQTTTEFANFVLRLQYRSGTDGKGAVRFRVQPGANPASSGYELRIDDRDPQAPTGSIAGIAKAGLAGVKTADIADAWRDIELRAEDDHLQVFLHDMKVVETRNARYRRGLIALRTEGGQGIRFRSIRLKPLLNTSLFNGKDLSEWWSLPNTRCTASVQDGALNLRGGKGQIETTSQWKDFALQMEIKTGAKHTNSGVFFRGEPRQRWNGYESQICNKWRDNDRGKPDDYGTGAIYNRQPARAVYSDDLVWFTMTIVAHGNHLATWVNGHQAADFTDLRPPHRNGRHGTKTDAGVISLQGHDLDGSLSFRNLRIAEYPPVGP